MNKENEDLKQNVPNNGENKLNNQANNLEKLRQTNSQQIIAWYDLKLGSTLCFESKKECCKYFEISPKKLNIILKNNEKVIKPQYAGRIHITNEMFQTEMTVCKNLKNWTLGCILHGYNEFGTLIYISPSARKLEKEREKKLSERTEPRSVGIGELLPAELPRHKDGRLITSK